MKKRLNGIDVLDLSKKYPLEPKLKKILKQGIGQKDGVTFLKFFEKNKLKSSRIKELDSDLVGLEMNINKFHIDLYIPEKKLTEEYVLQQGIAFAVALKDELFSFKKTNQTFKIIVFTDEGEDSFPAICNVGFYTIRQNQVWLLEDLEKYKTNGLLVFIV